MASESMSKTLAARLKAHPPFDRLADDTVRQMVDAMEVRYFDRGHVVFEEGTAALDTVYLLHKGTVRLTRDGELAAMCEAGDLFGVRAHLAGRGYVATATVGEDALLYTWPATRFVAWTEQLPPLAVHLASGFAVEGPIGHLTQGAPMVLQQAQTVQPVRDLLSCAPTATVREAAQAMSDRHVGSILVVDEARLPVGIVTDVDLRQKVVAEGRDASTPIDVIMSHPVATIRDAPTLTEATIAMAASGIHHLVTTEDGTPATPATGMVTHHDLLIESGENPGVLVRALSRAKSDADLRAVRERLDGVVASYLEASLSIGFVARVTAAVTDQITRRAIAFAIDELGSPPVPFVWLALGSQGRMEQILKTDQDNALLFAEGPHQDYFLRLAARVVDSLHAVGFERCPAEMMASNPEWCGSLEHWQGVFSRWIEVPEPKALLHSNIFFDFRALDGEPGLALQLRNYVFSKVREERRFLSMLANNALANPPPLSLFGGFVLERSGEHRKQFDIKARAMMPFADAARVLSLDLEVRESGTLARFQAAARHPNLEEVCTAAARAYAPLLELRTQQGRARGDGGRFVDLDAIDAYERQRLRHAFRVLGDVQRTLTVRYQTDLIR